jgi:hypothetical protein
VDGLIGTDVFVKFLITVDFPARKLHLDPLFASAGVDDDPSGEAQPFAHAFGFGHFLLLRTQAGNKASGLFAIDTGANVSSISPELAKQVSETRLLNAPVIGMSRSMNSPFIADGVTLQFGKWRRRDQRLITVDLHSVSKDRGTEISGQIWHQYLGRCEIGDRLSRWVGQLRVQIALSLQPVSIGRGGGRGGVPGSVRARFRPADPEQQRLRAPTARESKL